MRRLMVVSVVGILAASDAQGQTKSKAPVTTTAKSAFNQLSFGNQKVATALYHAQSSKETTPATRPFTLEQIAEKRRGGHTWGQVFRELKAQGLVREKSLGHVVARYQQTLDSTPGLLASDRSGGKFNAYEAGSNGSAGGAVHGVGKGGK